MIPPSDFGNLLKSLAFLLEYDRVYPEGKKALNDIKEQKEKARAQNSGAKKLVKGIITVFMGDQDLDKKKANIEIPEIEVGSELHLRQAEVLRNTLETLIGQQELEIDGKMKLKALDILEYSFTYKQDKLLSNSRKVFCAMLKDLELVELFRSSQDPYKAV